MNVKSLSNHSLSFRTKMASSIQSNGPHSTGLSSISSSNGLNPACPDGKHIEVWPSKDEKELYEVTKSGNQVPLRFVAEKIIGEGGFGIVYLGHRQIWMRKYNQWACYSEREAIKVLDNPESDHEKNKRIEAELIVHKALKNNENIVKPKRTIEFFKPGSERIRKCSLLIMEYCEMGDLRQYLRNSSTGSIISEELAHTITYGVLKGLDVLLSKEYFHRDIKDSNIFVTKDNVFKLGDFGLIANKANRNKIECGTPTFMAPEMNGKDYYDEKVDVWSLGILLFKLLFGEHPFHHNNNDEIRKRARNDSLKFPSK